MAAEERKGITRRRFLAGGAAAAGLLVAGGYGRFVFGDEFEEHVAGVLGIPVDAAERLVRGARDRLGGVEYELRASAFLSVTTFPGRLLAPRSLRRKAVRPFLEHLLDRSIENMIYLGLQKPTDSDACTGLLRP